MKLNAFEFAMMNNPVRAASQRRLETPYLIGRRGALAGKRVLEVGCGRGVGFRVRLETGLGCPSCATRVRNSLLAVRGVVEAQVLESLGVAHVTYNPQLTDVPRLVQAVAQAGDDRRHAYRAQLVGGPGVEAY